MPLSSRMSGGRLDGRVFLQMPGGRRAWIRGDAFSRGDAGYSGPSLPVLGVYDRLTRTVFADLHHTPPSGGDAFLLSLVYVAWATGADADEVRRQLTGGGLDATGPLTPMSVARFVRWCTAGHGEGGSGEGDRPTPPPGAARLTEAGRGPVPKEFR